MDTADTPSEQADISGDEAPASKKMRFPFNWVPDLEKILKQQRTARGGSALRGSGGAAAALAFFREAVAAANKLLKRQGKSLLSVEGLIVDNIERKYQKAAREIRQHERVAGAGISALPGAGVDPASAGGSAASRQPQAPQQQQP